MTERCKPVYPPPPLFQSGGIKRGIFDTSTFHLPFRAYKYKMELLYLFLYYYYFVFLYSGSLILDVQLILKYSVDKLARIIFNNMPL